MSWEMLEMADGKVQQLGHGLWQTIRYDAALPARRAAETRDAARAVSVLRQAARIRFGSVTVYTSRGLPARLDNCNMQCNRCATNADLQGQGRGCVAAAAEGK